MDDPLRIPRGPLHGPSNESQEEESVARSGDDAAASFDPPAEPVPGPPAEPAPLQRYAPGAQEETRRRNLRQMLSLLLPVTLAGFALSAWILVRVDSPLGGISNGPQEIVRAQLRAVDQGEFRPAYDMFSERYRRQVSFDVWHELIVTHWRMFHGEVLRSGELAQSGPGVTLVIHLRTSDERQYRARFTLIRHSGRWWIDDVHWAEEADEQTTERT